MKPPIILETTKRNFLGYYYVIIPDNAAGYKHRYTVYRMPDSAGGEVAIIGRELPLGFSRDLIRKDMDKNDQISSVSTRSMGTRGANRSSHRRRSKEAG